jgi:hypothetical protein
MYTVLILVSIRISYTGFKPFGHTTFENESVFRRSVVLEPIVPYLKSVSKTAEKAWTVNEELGLAQNQVKINQDD